MTLTEFKIDIAVRRHWRHHVALWYYPLIHWIPGLRWIALKMIYSGISYQMEGQPRRRLSWPRDPDRVAAKR